MASLGPRSMTLEVTTSSSTVRGNERIDQSLICSATVTLLDLLNNVVLSSLARRTRLQVTFPQSFYVHRIVIGTLENDVTGNLYISHNEREFLTRMPLGWVRRETLTVETSELFLDPADKNSIIFTFDGHNIAQQRTYFVNLIGEAYDR